MRDLINAHQAALGQVAAAQVEHSEVRPFYGAVNASKTLPERAKLPQAPKTPKLPSGVAA